jgi:rhodanese-related sulfurtransferase
MAYGSRGSRRRWLTGAVLLAAAGIAVAHVAMPRGADGDLARLEQRIASEHPDIPHVRPTDLATSDGDGREVVIFDVREDHEFSVSRVPGAIRIDPSIDTAGFLQAHGDRIAGRKVVLYCSVGVRSSRLARQLTSAATARGAKGVYNLSGGIFRWHNERRELVDSAGVTDAVHPYDEFWGTYLQRRSSGRFTPTPRS